MNKGKLLASSFNLDFIKISIDKYTYNSKVTFMEDGDIIKVFNYKGSGALADVPAGIGLNNQIKNGEKMKTTDIKIKLYSDQSRATIETLIKSETMAVYSPVTGNYSGSNNWLYYNQINNEYCFVSDNAMQDTPVTAHYDDIIQCIQSAPLDTTKAKNYTAEDWNKRCTSQQIAEYAAIVRDRILTVAEYIRTNLPLELSCGNRYIDGVWCYIPMPGRVHVYYNGYAPIVSLIAGAEKALYDVCKYREDVINAAKKIALENASKLYGKIYRHDGKKFVVISKPK